MNKSGALPAVIGIAIVGAGALALALLVPTAAVPGPSAAAPEGAPGYVRFVPDNLFAVSFVNTNLGWAAGYYGTLLQTTDGGHSWVRRPLPQNDLIRRARFLDDRIGWAISHRGRIFFTQDGGSNWVVQHEVPGIYLRDVAMVDRQNGWVVGHEKTILHTADGGKTWETQTFAHQTQDPPRLNGIAAYDGTHAVAVGEFGVIARTDDGGRTWTQVPSPTQTTYTAVAVAKDHAIAVGLGGIMTYIPLAGGSATLIEGTPPLALFDVALDGSGNGFAVGAGSAYRLAGATQTPVKISVSGGSDLVWLGGISLRPGGGAVAVGSRGLIVEYDPRKNSFVQLTGWASGTASATDSNLDREAVQ